MSQRIMALDVGDVRIGVAVTDETNTISTAVGVIKRQSLEKDIQNIESYIKEYSIAAIVVGLPINLSEKETTQTKKVRSFIGAIKKKIILPIATIDESLTTKEAEEMLISAGISRKKRKEVIDKVAAQIILQDYLAEMKNKKD